MKNTKKSSMDVVLTHTINCILIAYMMYEVDLKRLAHLHVYAYQILKIILAIFKCSKCDMSQTENQ
jgi:ABC-type ATPase with predicted acetyltransferase domain